MPGVTVNGGGWTRNCGEGGRERPCPNGEGNDDGSERGTGGADDAGGPAEEGM